MKVIEMELHGHGKCIIGEVDCPAEIVADHIRNMIDADSIGETITVKLLEITEEEYNNLSEWEGW